ncbi:MAG: hypothetical protein K0Q59_3881 [Paenibacillus sp.]|jgi:hypothetical protein|nr:hypothetical protein [Paenibacillus sp.]
MVQIILGEGVEADLGLSALEAEAAADQADADAETAHLLNGDWKATISRQVASKWVKTSVLRQDSRIAQHIPETRIFSPGNLAAMLSRYGKVVMKPVVGTGGQGVIMIIQSGSTYTIRHRKQVSQYSSFNKMAAAVGVIRRKRSYLVQRGIHLATIGGRPIDYRVKVVKERGKWVTRSMVGRLANPGMFVTNLCRGGTMLSSAEGIRRSLSGSMVRRKKNEMRHITSISIKLLERYFPGVGQLGFDYGFDTSGRLWIFEVNTKPH